MYPRTRVAVRLAKAASVVPAAVPSLHGAQGGQGTGAPPARDGTRRLSSTIAAFLRPSVGRSRGQPLARAGIVHGVEELGFGRFRARRGGGGGGARLQAAAIGVGSAVVGEERVGLGPGPGLAAVILAAAARAIAGSCSKVEGPDRVRDERRQEEGEGEAHYRRFASAGYYVVCL